MGPITEEVPARSVVVYEQDGDPILALVIGKKADKYLLLNEKGRQLELAASRLKLFKVFAATALSSKEQESFLLGLGSQIRKMAQTIELEELWSTLAGTTDLYCSEDLAGLYFAKASAEQELATHIRLVSQKVFFKRDRDKFVARSPEIVEELKKAEISVKQKIHLRAAFIEWIKNPKAQLIPELLPLVEKIKLYATQAELSVGDEREAKDAIELALNVTDKGSERVSPLSAYALLEKVEIFNNLTNPAWIRSKLPSAIALNNTAKDEATATSVGYEDLRDLDCFTIDDESTHDMDDALSLKITNDGYQLGIHISDVAAYVTHKSDLDIAVSKRLSSVYLPEKTINMLPDRLANESLSLLKDCDRPVVSVLVNLDADFTIRDYRFCLGIIKVQRRWSYDQIDQVLESGISEFNSFYEISSVLESKRIANGALQVNKQELSISIGDDGRVNLREVEEHGPARTIVAEMAILYNRLSAEFLSAKGVSAIFRGQATVELSALEQDQETEERAKDYGLRSRLKPSVLSSSPRPHSSLGLNCYMQASSPIRRYFDLINQRQIVSVVRGETVIYSEQDLQKMIEDGDETLARINRASKESRRFWLMRYLEQRIATSSLGRKIKGVVVKIGPKLPFVELDEVFFCSYVKTPRKLKVGEQIEVEISAVDARDAYLRLEAR
jgi:exoribonuclease-2